ncbi:MAG TPA: EamA family transporter [Thermoleophilaceae bacterium]|nr:EamA family transporter [Thermoleophilaceae bacterium]
MRTAHIRRPARGYLLAAVGAAMFALNGSLARYLLDDGIGAARLSQLRSAGSWLVLLFALALMRRDLLRVERAELPALAFLGVFGLAATHATYFLAIDRLEIGPAATIQYLAPLLLLVWLRVVHARRLAGSLWGAVALSLAGCFLVVRAYDAGSLDALGVVAALGAMVSFAVYLVGSERAGHVHQPLTTLFWSFAFASVFWALVIPWWSFPWHELSSARNASLAAGVVVVGTLLPFICMVSALRHLPAARAAVVATLEPVLAAAFAWVIHDEALAAVQVAGGAVVLSAVAWVQSRAPDLDAELAPLRATRSSRRAP